MVARHFIKRFYTAFFVFIICLSIIFAFGDMLVRLATLPSFFSLPTIFALMFPLMTLFSFPLASSLAVQTIVGSLFLEDEILFFQFFSKARRKLHVIVLLFSLSLTALYIPLVFQWAPTSYWKAKRYIINSVKEQFEHLQANVFHTIVPHFTFFYKEKGYDGHGSVVFKHVILSVKDAHDVAYFITARECHLENNKLIISHGTIQNKSRLTWYSGTFEETNIDLEQFLQDEKIIERPVKFLTIKELLSRKKHDAHGYVEFHKRIAQVIWQFLFPLLALWGMLIIGERQSTLLASLIVSGGLFLYSYIGLSLAQAFAKDAFIALLCLYGCSSLAVVGFYVVYKRKW